MFLLQPQQFNNCNVSPKRENSLDKGFMGVGEVMLAYALYTFSLNTFRNASDQM